MCILSHFYVYQVSVEIGGRLLDADQVLQSRNNDLRIKLVARTRLFHLEFSESNSEFSRYNAGVIQRTYYLNQLKTAIDRSPVTALLGPRQCGKTTLGRQLAEHQEATFFDIESVPDRRRHQNPELVLGSLKGFVVID